MKLTYHHCGDSLLPDLGLAEKRTIALARYGRMRLNDLKEHRLGLFGSLLLFGKLMQRFHEIDETCNACPERLIPHMRTAEGTTEELKATDQLAWIRYVNDIRHQIEEILLEELIYVW